MANKNKTATIQGQALLKNEYDRGVGDGRIAVFNEMDAQRRASAGNEAEQGKLATSRLDEINDVAKTMAVALQPLSRAQRFVALELAAMVCGLDLRQCYAEKK